VDGGQSGLGAGPQGGIQYRISRHEQIRDVTVNRRPMLEVHDEKSLAAKTIGEKQNGRPSLVAR